MQAEDGAKEEMHKSVEKEENKTAEDAQQPPLLQSENESVLQRDRTSKQNDRSNATGYLAISLQTRKRGIKNKETMISQDKRGTKRKAIRIKVVEQSD
ncbi:hypothetical protein MTR_2g104465 [Medicago truncatula]|uniref:Uncharacterized protein n=1 Tax=Medicago truncatula TaxID=3880 RepID=A0A072VCT1_MEDTR|nr:hypothetical protein MTR_2g104465 [Medicago truncatula]